MPRKRIPISSEYPYSISARCINKEWFTIPLREVWAIMEDYLYLLKHGFDFKIHSFVLMSNHFHLVVSTPKANLGEGMNYFMRETSKQIGFRANRINQIYGSRFYRSLITKNHYYMHAYKYIYRNPAEAKLCKSVTDYKFSTLSGLVGNTRLVIPVEYDPILFESFDQTLRWLNTAPSEKHKLEIQRALCKAQFKLVADQITGKKSDLENILY